MTRYNETAYDSVVSTATDIYTYDECGNVLTEYLDNYSDSWESYAYTYDERGNVLNEYYGESDGNWSNRIRTYDGDNILTEYSEYSYNGWYAWYRDTYTYDESGNTLSKNNEQSNGYWANDFYTYDSNGNILTEYHEAAGDIWTMCTNLYDEDGNVLFKKGESSDGTWETNTYSYVSKEGLAEGMEILSCAPREITAVVSSQRLFVNGIETEVGVYSIDDANYFKLRDMAYLLSGTEKSFDISYDDVTNTIVIITGAEYSPAGGELERDNAEEVTAVSSTAEVRLNGTEINLSAFEINGNNYFKLRDIAEQMNFGVEYDETTDTINIVTSSE